MAKVSGMLFQLVQMSGRTVRMERLLFAMGRETHMVFIFFLSLCSRERGELACNLDPSCPLLLRW